MNTKARDDLDKAWEDLWRKTQSGGDRAHERGAELEIGLVAKQAVLESSRPLVRELAGLTVAELRGLRKKVDGVKRLWRAVRRQQRHDLQRWIGEGLLLVQLPVIVILIPVVWIAWAVAHFMVAKAALESFGPYAWYGIGGYLGMLFLVRWLRR